MVVFEESTLGHGHYVHVTPTSARIWSWYVFRSFRSIFPCYSELLVTYPGLL